MFLWAVCGVDASGTADAPAHKCNQRQSVPSNAQPIQFTSMQAQFPKNGEESSSPAQRLPLVKLGTKLLHDHKNNEHAGTNSGVVGPEPEPAMGTHIHKQMVVRERADGEHKHTT